MMFNFTAIDRESDVETRFSIGCRDAAEKAREALLERMFAVSDIEEGPPPERSPQEQRRATRILGKIFGH